MMTVYITSFPTRALVVVVLYSSIVVARVCNEKSSLQMVVRSSCLQFGERERGRRRSDEDWRCLLYRTYSVAF
eukprot:scaffold24048_cov194-Amphora_coffeaeformis.AAC.1